MLRILLPAALAIGITTGASAQEAGSIRAQWKMPARCVPFGPVRVEDLKEELRQTGYRLVIAIHPDKREKSSGEYPPRDLYIINADGTGLKQLTNTPDAEERVPRTSPDGKMFTYNYGSSPEFVGELRAV